MKLKLKKVVAALLAVSICFNTIDVTAMAKELQTELQEEAESTSVLDADSTQDEWDGVTTEATYKGENFKVIFSLTGLWNGGYNANVKIENTGDAIIENWILGFDYSGGISNIWNATISSEDEGNYTIKNAVWNQDIPIGGNVEFGFTGSEDFQGFPQSYNLLGDIIETNEEDYSIEYLMDSDWGSGFKGIISITNNTDTVIEDWILEFDFNRDISSIWNSVIESSEKNHYVIKNAGYNANIVPGQTISFGFLGENGNKKDVPENYTLYSYSEIDDSTVELNINTDEYEYNEQSNCYVVNSDMETLSGTLSDCKNVKSLTYEVRDLNGMIVKEDSTSIKENWTIKQFGLVVGYNIVTITAELKSGKQVKAEIACINHEVSNMNRTSVDMEDFDADGLCNYYEDILTTDKNKTDTDGDGLTDYEEFLKTGTDPTVTDTDGNGITDDQEDFDSDGLNNISEMKSGSNCYSKDTDEDSLSDGDEVLKYHTDPLTKDTDGDGLSDYEDIQLGFDPNKPDTDENGIGDGDEMLYQTYTQQIDTSSRKGINSVSVSLECNGYIDNRVTITDSYDLDMRSSDVVGLIGVPVEISSDVEFSTADITFTYDEKALGETSEDDLCIMWYDEEHDNYVLLEDSVLDKKNNTITYKTKHFSTYLVIDKQMWLDTMRMNINYRTAGDITYYDIAFVVDVSASMGGNRINNARTALNGFVDAMLENDYAGIVKFNSIANTIQTLTNDQDLLHNKINTLSAGGATNADAGIQAGIQLLKNDNSTNDKMLILLCDGDVNYNAATINLAKENGITIHCINVVNGSSTAMEKIASETGGIYYYAATTADIQKVVSELKDNTVESIDMTDSDGDGLYDVYEVNGMRLSNGQVVYTDPNNPDSDGDGINDYDAMGGDPVIESYMIGGNVYSCTLNHSVVYGKLSSEFIYVDGTLNSNGKQYFGKMDYVPYSNSFIKKKYEENVDITFKDETRQVKGDAGIYNSFSDKLATLNKAQLLGYAAIGSYTVLATSLLDSQAGDCLYIYIQGTGGRYDGLVEGSTREYLYATPKLGTNIFGINSANTYFLSNMNKAKIAAESVLNEYNTEVYISISPETTWTGCHYNDCQMDSWKQNIDSILNIGAFGIYNVADAGVTLHCMYDPETQEYSMEYIYYIIDYYDFTLYDPLNEMNALGLARSYELYGVAPGVTSWKKNENSGVYWLY